MKTIINKFSRIWLIFDKHALYYMFDGSCVILFFFFYYIFLLAVIPKDYKLDKWLFLSLLMPIIIGIISFILFQYKRRD